MKKITALVLLTSICFAQAKFSENFSAINYSLSKRNSVLNKNNLQLSKTVFGCLPWWEYIAGSHQYIDYDLISHLAIFSFEADSLGNLKNPIGWPWNDVINLAKSKNVKLILAVTNFNGNEISKLMNDSLIRSNLFEKIKQLLLQNDFSGVNIDFENLLEGNDKRISVNNFMSLLNNFLKAENKNFEISFSSPSYGYGNWDFPKLSESCDYLFVMNYDYYGSWSDKTGPSSPLTGQFFSVTNSIEQEYKNVHPNKIILGVPYYGNIWKAKSGLAYSNVVPFDSSKTENDWLSILKYREVITTLQDYEKMWDDISQTSWLRKKVNDTTWYQIWYDDSLSLSKKYDLALQKNLMGVGIWALGYDGNRKELWELIRKKFTNPTLVVNDSLTNKLFLYPNYPNPFNPTTVISYMLPKSGYVSLKIYDVLGREISILVNDYQSSGTYNINFNVNEYGDTRFTSGFYIINLLFDKISISRKLLFIK